MAQTGFTPIQLYNTSTATAVPVNTNLANGELAINITDEKLYFKNAAGVVKLLASNAGSTPVTSFSAGSTGLTPNTATTGAVTLAGTLAVLNGGTGVTSSTGSGNNVLSNSPTLVTPVLGAATATSLQGILGNVTPAAATATDLNYTGTLTGGTGVVNLGSGQVFKDASGNVGIGTSSPTYKLDVQSTTNALVNIKTNTTGFALLTIDSAASNQAIAIFKAAGVEQARIFSPANEAASTLVFARGTGSTESMRIDSSGNLMVGRNAPYFASKVSVESTNPGQVSAIHNNSFGQVFFSNGIAAASTNWLHFYGVSSNNSVQNVVIYGNGNIINANNSYGALSDVKLKENIVDASPKLEKLDQVRVVNYNLKGDYEQHKQLGVIAQELENIFPGMVEETYDRDAEDNRLDTTTKSVKYSVFVPMLIKAIQELKAIVDTQAARITALEAK